MVVDKKLAEKKLFWKTLFETENLAPQMIPLATQRSNGIALELPHFGQVRAKVVAASALGDNFMSDTFIVTAYVAPRNPDSDTIVYKTFVKVLPSNLLLRQAAYESHVHHREINMYNTFFDILRELDPNQPVPLDVPDVYFVHLEEAVIGGTDGAGTCILLEDLKAEGFTMSDKIVGADYRHCELALTSLAHYHALTLVTLRKWIDPTTGECTKIPPGAKFILEKTLFDTGTVEMIRNWGPAFVNFTKDIERPDLSDWLNSLLENLEELMPYDDFKTSGPLACILHGDYWNNNMLFKYAPDENNPDGKHVPVALKMVDFQIARIGHPLSDIIYFLYTSAQPETREKHLEELLRLYFDILMADTKLLGVTINDYTFENFMADYKKRSLRWLFMGAVVMTMVLNKEMVTSLQDLDKEEKLKEPKPVSDVEPEKGASGMSLELEESMKSMVTSTKLSNNPVLSNRLLRLILEVKALNNS